MSDQRNLNGVTFGQGALGPPQVNIMPGAPTGGYLAALQALVQAINGENTAITNLANKTFIGVGASGITYVKFGGSTSFTLANGTVAGQRVGIKDDLGTASPTNHLTITGAIDGGTSVFMDMPFSAFEFVWDTVHNWWMRF